MDNGVLLLVEGNDHFEDGFVFLVVFSERKQLDKDGQNVVEGDVVGVSLDHAGDAAGGVVEKTCFLLLVEQGLELSEDGVVLAGDLCFIGGFLAQKASAVSSVRADFWVFVSEALPQPLHQRSGLRGDRSTHVTHSLSNSAYSSTALVLLLA